MCSGCSGDYEGDSFERSGDSDGDERDWFVRERPVKPLSQKNYIDRSEHRSQDDYEVLVSEERIVEVRRIRSVSAGSRSLDDSVQGATGAAVRSSGERRELQHSWLQSAKHYGTPFGDAMLASDTLEGDCMWLISRGLAALQRFGTTMRSLFV
jgi:hypothetical protein